MNENKGITYLIRCKIQHYNHEKYWKMRQEVTNKNSKKAKIVRLWYLYQIKKSDAFANASTGTLLGGGAVFKSAPILPHRLNGIVINRNAKIGKNCMIFQQVTIGVDQKNTKAAPVIGDNVMIGAGAKIIGNVKIGNNVKIGANAVVTKNIPDNCTAVGIPAKVISKKEK